MEWIERDRGMVTNFYTKVSAGVGVMMLLPGLSRLISGCVLVNFGCECLVLRTRASTRPPHRLLRASAAVVGRGDNF
jgi:hypothetical protein